MVRLSLDRRPVRAALPGALRRSGASAPKHDIIALAMPSERVQRQIDALLDQIERAASRLDWATVRELSDGVLALDPDNRDANAFLEAAARALDPTPAAGPPDAEPTLRGPSPPLAAASQDSFGDGRYRVSRLLGEGGKKRVYLARDSLLDRDVAPALIKTEGLDDVGRERIRREAQAMARLGEHPHIVPVLDLGEERGQPFIVSQYMAGGDVAELLGGAGGSLPIERVLELARGICGGLEFAHSKNVVHRDLKPSNVFLTEDGAAKVGDFGVALALDRSRLTQDEGSTPIGTPNYMPPEQAIGGEVTHRADLYSLGALLYELMCGRPPFVGDDPWVVITQHLGTPPVAPSWHTDACPPDLEALVLRLLEKSPDDRPESASEVLGILERIDAAQEGGQPAGANPLERLARGVFVGREQELEQLRAAFDRARSGVGGVVMVVGEPGIGKTRIVQELETYARMRGGEVLWGRAHEAAGAPAYWPWVQAIRSYVTAAGSDELRSQLGTAAPEVARIVPEVRGAYRRWVHAIRSYLAASGPEELRSQLAAGASEVARIVPEVRERFPDLPEPEPASDSESAQFRLLEAITTFLKNASAETPLVVVLDDLHWVEKPALLLLEHLSRELGSARLLLVGTYRDLESGRQGPLEEALAQLSQGGQLQTVDLRGLSEEDVAAYIREAAGVEPSSQLVHAVYGETEGNPFFVSEVISLMAQEGTLESGEVSVPPGVRTTVGRRLGALSEGCHELLTLAAVVGRSSRTNCS